MNKTISKGKLLVAMPMLRDPNFCQAVVLLCDYGPQGAMGIILNRPTEILVSALVHNLPKVEHSERLYDGGPVSKNGMLVLCRGHADLEKQEGEIIEGILLTKNFEPFKQAEGAQPFSEMRCYLGYAGWAPGQLEAEIKSGAWISYPADTTLVFDADPLVLWPQMMRRLGPEWAFYATMPQNPRMN